ncbi:hypothetical protein C8Q79DRAFT_731287 [Trametes meyenii]|nr:hypothetical protein C8Q79DRAFT_731287 [Trametes meyenii]
MFQRAQRYTKVIAEEIEIAPKMPITATQRRHITGLEPQFSLLLLTRLPTTTMADILYPAAPSLRPIPNPYPIPSWPSIHRTITHHHSPLPGHTPLPSSSKEMGITIVYKTLSVDITLAPIAPSTSPPPCYTTVLVSQKTDTTAVHRTSVDTMQVLNTTTLALTQATDYPTYLAISSTSTSNPGSSPSGSALYSQPSSVNNTVLIAVITALVTVLLGVVGGAAYLRVRIERTSAAERRTVELNAPTTTEQGAIHTEGPLRAEGGSSSSRISALSSTSFAGAGRSIGSSLDAASSSESTRVPEDSDSDLEDLSDATVSTLPPSYRTRRQRTNIRGGVPDLRCQLLLASPAPLSTPHSVNASLHHIIGPPVYEVHAETLRGYEMMGGRVRGLPPLQQFAEDAPIAETGLGRGTPGAGGTRVEAGRSLRGRLAANQRQDRRRRKSIDGGVRLAGGPLDEDQGLPRDSNEPLELYEACEGPPPYVRAV